MVVHVILTGFGRFQGVESNPTTKLIGRIQIYLKEHPLENRDAVSVVFCKVLETSGVGSLFGLFELQQKYRALEQNRSKQHHEGPKSNDESNVIWLHFGVSGIAECFHLETVAWNEASFRVPDERGWSPDKQKIIPELGSIHQSLSSNLPLPEMQQNLTQKGFEVKLSDDPGRFVCNWTYFHSLHFSQINGSRSLFVHVPPFEVIPEENQLQFVRELLDVIAIQCA